MFIGDGINDGPVLAQADVGVAINSASSLTIDAAGIVLMKDDLKDVVNALRISKSSFRRIKINLFLSFIYNIILIPIAMGIFYPAGFTLDPMFAGIAMAASSLSVMVSSLLLKLYRPLKDDAYDIKPSKKVRPSSYPGVSKGSYTKTEIADPILNDGKKSEELGFETSGDEERAIFNGKETELPNKLAIN